MSSSAQLLPQYIDFFKKIFEDAAPLENDGSEWTLGRNAARFMIRDFAKTRESLLSDVLRDKECPVVDDAPDLCFFAADSMFDILHEDLENLPKTDEEKAYAIEMRDFLSKVKDFNDKHSQEYFTKN